MSRAGQAPRKYSALTPDRRRVLLEEGQYFDREGVLRRSPRENSEADIHMLVSLAIEKGKLLASQREWAITFGRYKESELRAYIADLSVLPDCGVKV